MPTLFNPIKNDQQDQNQFQAGNGSQQPQPAQTPAQPVSISGSTAASPDEANGQKTNKPTSSGRFQNLNAYLKANSGTGVANRVNDTLSSKGNELQQNFANAKQNYDQSVNDAKQRYAPDNGAQQNGYTYRSTGDTPGWYQDVKALSPIERRKAFDDADENGTEAPVFQRPTLADPTMQSNLYNDYINKQYLSNPESMNADNIAKFTQLRDASYQGPTQMDQDNVLRNQSQDFSNLANQTGTEGGRYSLLRQIYNNPNSTYSQGQQNLDNLLLQSNPQQLAQLQNSKVLAGQIQNQLGNSVNQSKVTAQNAAQQVQTTQDQTRKALNDAILGFDNGMNSKVKEAVAEQAKKYQAQQQALGTGKLTSQEAIDFGLIKQYGDTGPSMYTLRPQDYLTMNNNYNINDPNVINQLKTQVAQGSDYSKLNALKGLEGNLAQGDVSKILDTYNDPTLAGTFQKQTPYSFNTAKWNTDLGNIANEYQGKIAGPNTQIGEASNELNSLTKNYNSAAEKAKAWYKQNAPYLDPTGKMAGISNDDFINNYGSAEDKNLVTKYNFETGKLSKAKSDLENLKKMYGIGNTLNITDADKYAPVSIGDSGNKTRTASTSSSPIMPATNSNLGRQVSVAPAPAPVETPVPFSGVLSKLGRRI